MVCAELSATAIVPATSKIPRSKDHYNENDELEELDMFEDDSGTATPASQGQSNNHNKEPLFSQPVYDNGKRNTFANQDDPLFLPASSQFSSQPVYDDDMADQKTRRRLGGVTEDQLGRMVTAMRLAGRLDRDRILAEKCISVLYGIPLEAVADWCDSNM